MGDFGADEGRYATYHPWADRLPRDASLGQARHGGDMRLAVFHYPIEGWTDAVVLNVLQGLAAAVTLEEMARVSYAPLADAFRDIAPREKRHTDLGIAGLAEIAATEEGRAAARAPSPTGSPRVADSFGSHQLRPVRDAEALRPPPPPERGAARRLDRPGPGRRSRPSASPEEHAHDRRRHHQAPHPRKLRRRPMGPRAPARARRSSTPPPAPPSPGSTRSGIDFAAALAWGRDAVGPKLRKLSFHERAAMLKALGQFLMANKEEFYAESLATGATRADGWIDIEGGAGTLLSYASKARRELPNTRVLTDGDVELLSRDSTFSAQHILTPLEGVAIHINAFNFPVWGMLEKVAPTFIAGLPSIVKPASQTAYLTELVVRRIVESGILPEGAIQLIAGSTGDLLDHVTGQDVVTFTGSAWTGRKLRSGPAIVENSTRFTMEADSLNAAILGPDAAPGTPEFDLFVKEVAREMTVKAGQKCTAIRRVIAPRAFTDALVAALGDRLAKTALGDPVERGDPHGRPRQPRPAQGGPRAHPRAAAGSRDRRRQPRRGHRSPPATPRRAPSSTPSSSSPTTRSPRPPSTTSRPSARSPPSCPTTTSTRPSRWPSAARAPSSPRSSPTTRPSPRKPSSASPPSTAASSSATA